MGKCDKRFYTDKYLSMITSAKTHDQEQYNKSITNGTVPSNRSTRVYLCEIEENHFYGRRFNENRIYPWNEMYNFAPSRGKSNTIKESKQQRNPIYNSSNLIYDTPSRYRFCVYSHRCTGNNIASIQLFSFS